MSEPVAYRYELRYDRWDEDAWHEVVRTMPPEETLLPEKDNVEIRNVTPLVEAETEG
jgi:hypothetical protein